MSTKTYTVLGLVLAGLLFPGLVPAARAVELAAPVFGVWEYNDDDDAPLARVLSGVDFSSEIIGIEALGLNDTFAVSAPNLSGKVISSSNAVLQVRNPDTGALLLAYSFETESGLYPDPMSMTGLMTAYYCGLDELQVDPRQTEFPCAERFGFGAANVGATRLLIVGDSLVGAYQNSIDGFVDVSRFRVTAFNLRNGNRRWTKTFRAIDSGGWQLALPLCAVGDFLNGDGDDELRIVQQREVGEGAVAHRYRYYDAKFGDFLKSVSFEVAAP